MRAEESRPGADTETAITNRADSMVDSTAYAPPEHAFGDADEVTRIKRERADAEQQAADEKSKSGSLMTKDRLIQEARDEHLAEYRDHIRKIGMSLPLLAHRDKLLGLIEKKFFKENAQRKSRKLPPYPVPKSLNEFTMVKILLATHDIVSVNLTNSKAGDDLSLLAVFQTEGPNRGTYVVDRSYFDRLISQLSEELKSTDIASVIKRLQSHAPVVRRCSAPHLSPVNNGIYNHKTGVLEEFSPEYVFLSKSPIDYDPHAESPVITMPDGEEWEVEKWILDLSDDEGVPELVWEIISAVLRPNERWNRSPWLFGTSGRNGKGTVMALLRNLVGDAAATLSIAAFGERFSKEPLLTSMAVLSDENDVGEFVKSSADFKAAVTGDPIQVDRKGLPVVSVVVQGIVVACFNGFPKIRDKTESFNRRPLMVPFFKNFASGERREIKSDYLARDDVLRYVLRRALQMPHTTLSEPEASREVMAQFRESNDPVRAFWNEFEDQFVWDLLPTKFVYDLYREWFSRNHPSGIPINSNDFSQQLRDIAAEGGTWEATPNPVRPGLKMSQPEPLIMEFGLTDWANSGYHGKTSNNYCIPCPLKGQYRGFVRT